MTPDIASLCERLRRIRSPWTGEAATALEALSARVELSDKWIAELVSHDMKDYARAQAAEAEVARLRDGMRAIQAEAERENGHWVHLKRVIGLQARAFLDKGMRIDLDR